MKAMRLFAMLLGMFVPHAVWADAGGLHGTWHGPWYIGMSSGTVILNMAADGTGTIALTNLSEFGSQPIPLAKQSFDGKMLTFSAMGANGAALTMSLKLGEAGKQLRGNGKHAGFGARMELRRAE